MKHLLIAVSCLFCLALPLLSGCGNNNEERVARMVEMPIGDGDTFVITNVLDDTTGFSTETFSLTMFVTVQQRDLRHFERRFEQCKIEVIDRVSTVLRASTTEERREGGHTAIKERVRREINEVLGTPWVQQVLFINVTHEVN